MSLYKVHSSEKDPFADRDEANQKAASKVQWLLKLTFS